MEMNRLLGSNWEKVFDLLAAGETVILRRIWKSGFKDERVLCDLRTLENDFQVQIESVDDLQKKIEDVWENSDPLDDASLVGHLDGEVSVFEWHWQDEQRWDLEKSESMNF